MRLAANIEEKIWKTQYGFRAKHSTAEALYITRRIQDFYETHGDKFFMLFLDWEKAFDKVDQKKLINALYRLNIPAKILKIIESSTATRNSELKMWKECQSTGNNEQA